MLLIKYQKLLIEGFKEIKTNWKYKTIKIYIDETF